MFSASITNTCVITHAFYYTQLKKLNNTVKVNELKKSQIVPLQIIPGRNLLSAFTATGYFAYSILSLNLLLLLSQIAISKCYISLNLILTDTKDYIIILLLNCMYIFYLLKCHLLRKWFLDKYN